MKRKKRCRFGAPSHHHDVGIMRSAGTRNCRAPERTLAMMALRRKQVILLTKPENTKTFICDHHALSDAFILFAKTELSALKCSAENYRYKRQIRGYKEIVHVTVKANRTIESRFQKVTPSEKFDDEQGRFRLEEFYYANVQ